MPSIPLGAHKLGETTMGSTAAATATISWAGFYGVLFIEHVIAGYSGSGIAILQFGTTAGTLDTGSNYASGGFHVTMGTAAVTATPTSRVSQVGVQVANDATANARYGMHQVQNPNGRNKQVDSRTTTYATTTVTAATAISTISVMEGRWFQNSPAQCVAMLGNGVNLLTGSSLAVYGIPG